MSPVRERSIMVLEDSEEDFAAFRRALKKVGNDTELVRYSDGETCLADLRSREDNPALLVLDLNLPALTGIEFLHELRNDAALRRIPVVILTTSANPLDVQRCYDLGIGGYLLKEGDFEGFCAKIGTLTDYWLRAVYLP